MMLDAVGGLYSVLGKGSQVSVPEREHLIIGALKQPERSIK